MGLALLRKIHGSDGKNIDFRFNYTPECMVSSMHFLKISGEGSPSPSADFYPRSISGCAFDLGFAPNSRALAPSIGSGFALNLPPPTCLLTPPQQEGTRSNTVPQPQLFVFPNTGLKISFQEYVVALKYTIEKLLTAQCRLGELLENPLG